MYIFAGSGGALNIFEEEKDHKLNSSSWDRFETPEIVISRSGTNIFRPFSCISFPTDPGPVDVIDWLDYRCNWNFLR